MESSMKGNIAMEMRNEKFEKKEIADEFLLCYTRRTCDSFVTHAPW